MTEAENRKLNFRISAAYDRLSGVPEIGSGGGSGEESLAKYISNPNVKPTFGSYVAPYWKVPAKSNAAASKMRNSRHADYPPSVTPGQEEYILSTIKDWCIQHGLVVRPSSSFVPEEIDNSGILATTAPVTLFPSPFPESCFQQGKLLQTTFNELYAAISSNEEWIEDIMKG